MTHTIRQRQTLPINEFIRKTNLCSLVRLAFVIAAIFFSATICSASATNVYVAQNSSGAANGADCANAFPVSWLNSSSNWGSGGALIGPGATVHLCGTITSPLTINGSGTSGNVITFLWETGARVSVAYGQIIRLNGSHGFLLFDGGIPCGPSTSCDSVEASNLTGYATGQAGIIEATGNGSTLANQDNQTQAFCCGNAQHDIEIRNLIIRNLYQHTSASDTTSNADSGNFVFQCAGGGSGCASGQISIHDSVIHDTGNALSFQRSTSATFNVYNIAFFRNNWGIENSGNGTRTINIHDNHIRDVKNWDTTSDTFHHNFLHNYMNVASDSLALNVYNNLADGDWGACCTTAALFFTETSAPTNFNVYNNVVIQSCANNTEPAMLYAATGGMFANNTLIGCPTTSSNVEAVSLSGTNIDFRNNAIQSFGQYIVVNAGTTFSHFDYNFYGPIGISGNSPWQHGTTGANSFSDWKTACSCDPSGSNSSSLVLNSFGHPQAVSPLIGGGTNLTGLGITALDSDKAGVARPSIGAWDRGAYQSGSITSTQPQPPTGLTVIVN